MNSDADQEPVLHQQSTKSLQRAIIAFATAGIFLTGLAASSLSVAPFYQQLKRDQEHLLLSILQSRRFAVQESIHRVYRVATHISDPTNAGETLQDYNAGKTSLAGFRADSTPILGAALAYNPDVLGVTRFDASGQLVLQVGREIPESYRNLPKPSTTALKLTGPFRLDGKDLIVVAAPILSHARIPVGTDLILVEPGGLNDALATRGPFEKPIRIAIAWPDSDGVHILTGDVQGGTTRPKRIAADAPVARLVKTAPRTPANLHRPQNGTASSGEVIAFGSIEGTDWTLLVMAGAHDLYLPANRQILNVAALLLGLTALASMAFVALLRPFSGRVILKASELEREIARHRETIRKLNQSQKRLNHVFNVSPAAIYSQRFDDTGTPTRFGLVSNAAAAALGFSPKELVSDPALWRDRLHADDRSQVLKNLSTVPRVGDLAHEYRFLHKDGSVRWIYDRLHLVRDERGAAAEIIGAWMDITERKIAEEQLRKLSLAVEQSPNVVMITDERFRIQYVNPVFTKVTGFEPIEVMGRTPRMLGSGKTTTATYRDIWQTIKSGCIWRGELVNKTKSGGFYVAREVIAPIIDAAGNITHYVAIQEDITETRDLSEKLHYQSSHDMTTGLMNRLEFERRLDRILAQTKLDHSEHVLAYMDLDQFRVINDTCGHGAGDELLRQVTQLLVSNIRQHDTLARLGGDEFGLLVENCTLHQAEAIIAKLVDRIRLFQFAWQDKTFTVGTSIGLAPITCQVSNASELLIHADAACYAAKDGGRDRVHVYRNDDAVLSRRSGEMHWVSELTRALDEERLILYFQPISPLGTRTDHDLHYELLIRMKNREGDIVLPGDFLPAAERYNLAPKIDRWVIRTALQWLADNPSQMQNLSVCAINLSGMTLGDRGLHAFILEEMTRSGIEPSKLCFEITETAAIKNISAATQFMTALKQAGCQFSLDDFGSGLSSFAYLKRLPVDFLKIDGIFVRDILTDPIDHSMVKSINDIGHVMGKKTIAEFVENQEILDVLRLMGIDYAQGYGIEKPRPLDCLLTDAA